MRLFQNYRKYLFERDTAFATVAVFLLIGFFAILPLNTGVLNPIKKAFSDFDFNDLAYAKLKKNAQSTLDERLLIVNIGDLDRAGIGATIEAISRNFKPKAIGLDLLFHEPKDSLADAYLDSVLRSTPQLVTASKIEWENKENIEYRGNFKNNKQYGFVNLIGEDQGTIRYYSPLEKNNGKKYLSFASALLKIAEPNAFNKLVSRKKEQEKINYTRKIEKYQVIHAEDIFEDRIAIDSFMNRIVLIGYVNDFFQDIEDKHFTPYNKNFAGKKLPDMNGVIIHANFISMVLDGNYVKKLPAWVYWLFVIFIAWMHMSLFIGYFIDDHIWFHLAAKIAQIASAVFFVWLGIFLFDKFSFNIDMKLPLSIIILSVDVIYFYEAFAVWAHEKWGYKTIFHHKTH